MYRRDEVASQVIFLFVYYKLYSDIVKKKSRGAASPETVFIADCRDIGYKTRNPDWFSYKTKQTALRVCFKVRKKKKTKTKTMFLFSGVCCRLAIDKKIRFCWAWISMWIALWTRHLDCLYKSLWQAHGIRIRRFENEIKYWVEDLQLFYIHRI